MIKKNDRIKLRITDMSVKGEGVGRYDGLAFFVKDAVIGDEVLAVVTKLKKGYGYAKTLEILERSAERTEPACPIASRCGGCQLMQLSYDSQLKFKEDLVRNSLTRIAGVQPHEFYPITGMDGNEPLHFRNKLQLPVGWDGMGHVVTGFYAGRTHHIVSAVSCCVSPSVNDFILERIRSFLEKNRVSAYNEETGEGIVRHVLLRNGFVTGQIMICLVINSDIFKSEVLEKEFASEFSSLDLSGLPCSCSKPWHISSICVNINKSRTNVILGDKIRCLWGRPYIEDVIESRHEGMKPLTFRINPLSFFQTNPVQTVKLYDKALEYADLKGNETVWDLYCGTGTISLFLAQKARRVFGVEIVPEAIEDAKQNAAANDIYNSEFICGKSEEVFLEKCRSCDEMVVVLDPPRKGCDAKLLDAIIDAQPQRIVYVSCDPATLARDIEILCRDKYEVMKVQPVDMFPHTVHVETVCLLYREKDDFISVPYEPENADYLKMFPGNATYEEIKEWIMKKYDVKVSSLYVAQVKTKHGLDMRDCYNRPRSENSRQPQVPADKEKMIEEALRHFRMID